MSNKGVPTKLFIGNLPDLCRHEELKAKFDKFGNVVEFDIVGNYGFAHYENGEEARAAADALNGTMYNGNNLRVEISHSKVRQRPGMGDKDGCYRCGKPGHWSKDCPKGPRRPRPRERDPYDDDPYMSDPYADPYYRSRYMPPPPPRYDPYYDPYDRRPLPPPRDPYMRERMADPYGRIDPYYYARRSPPPTSGAARDPYGKDPYMKDPYNKDPYIKDPYAPRSGEPRDPFDETLERRRAYAAAMRSAPYAKPPASTVSTSSYMGAASGGYSAPPSNYSVSSSYPGQSSSYAAPSSGYSASSGSTYNIPVQSSRVPGPY